MSRRRARMLASALGSLAAALVAVVVWNSADWVGAPFPGFFLMANRVVPSISLPDWPGSRVANLFQSQVVAVDGEPVDSAAAVYAAVREQPAGTPIEYLIRAPGGATRTVVVPSAIFRRSDYALLFGAYLLNGIAFFGIGLLVYVLRPRSAASEALLAAGAAIGTFVITATDLYGPHWFFRLHVIAECLAPAACLHLALVFPVDALGARRSRALAAVYAPFALLAVVYEIALGSPDAYTAVHLVATASHGLATVAVMAAQVHGFFSSRSALVRRRIGVVVLGAFAGFLVPGVLAAASAAFGGGAAINASALTAFLFPASVGYAILQRDLFEIDAVLRRAVVYALVVLAIGALYLAAFFGIGRVLPVRSDVGQAPLALAVLQLVLLFSVVPIRARVQRAVDRVFFRKRYDAERVLADLGEALAAQRSTDEVVRTTLRTLAAVLEPESAAVFVADPTTRGVYRGRTPEEPVLELPDSVRVRLEHGVVVARYEWDDMDTPLPEFWTKTEAELLVPVRSHGRARALVALGRKLSGHAYTMHDIGLLQSAAPQVALALGNAEAFSRLAQLNASLEIQVAERTAALADANDELSDSLQNLQLAYERLERSQASLLRADRLAALGRLTAGIAHEVNTPLAAVGNALKVLRDLGQEYVDAIDDPQVLPEDHREIANEIRDTAAKADLWARKASAFVNRVKLHGRELRTGVVEPFAVAQVVAETEMLVHHRLRSTSCHLGYRESPPGVELQGDAARLGQVLVNLVGNAIDAYEDAGIFDGRVEIEVDREGDVTTLKVRDQAGGIAPEVFEHIFDELFTTKEPGRGTGLGLWIARNLVEEGFGGTLVCDTTLGVGSCFTATFPASWAAAAPVGAGEAAEPFAAPPMSGNGRATDA